MGSTGSDLLIVLLWFAVTALSLLIYTVFLRLCRTSDPLLESLAETLHFSYKGGSKLTGVYKGSRVQISRLLTADGHYRFEFEVDVWSPVKVSLCPSRFYPEHARRHRLTHEAQSGNPDFDSEFAPLCNHVPLAKKLLKEAAIQDGLKDLFDTGVLCWQLDHHQLIVLKDTVSASSIRSFLDKLFAVNALIPKRNEAQSAEAPIGGPLSGALYLYAFFLVAAGALCATYSDAFFQIERGYQYADIAMVSGSLLLLYVVFALILLCNFSSRSHHCYRSLPLAVLGSYLLGVYGPSVVNSTFDTSAVYHEDVRVVGKYLGSLDAPEQDTYWMLKTESLPDPEKSRLIKVDRILFPYITEGSVLRVTARRGALGKEWIENIEAAPVMRARMKESKKAKKEEPAS